MLLLCQVLPLCDSLMVDSVVDALHHLISMRDPPIQPSVQPFAAARVLAEIKSRSVTTPYQVMAGLLRPSEKLSW